MKGEDLWDILFPKNIYCAVCGKYINKSRKYGLCDHCIKHMNFESMVIDNELDYSMAAMGYGVYERRLIFNLKYDRRTYIARDIADIMYDAIFKQAMEEKGSPLLMADMIIPVPLHKERMKTRGFNQSEKIATYFGKKTGIPVRTDILLRNKNTDAQRALSKEQRMLNMKEAFSIDVGKDSYTAGKKILLLDDIYTTGATSKACAYALANVQEEKKPEKIYYISLLFAGNKNHLMIK